MKSRSRLILLWWLLLLCGGGGWGALLFTGEPTVWRALLVAFHYIVPLAAGLVVWSAIAVSCRGRWMKSLEKVPLAAVWFGIPSLILTVLIWLGVASWSPWHGNLHQGKWLADHVVMTRNVVLLAVFWALAFYYGLRRGDGKGLVVAPWVVIVYGIVFSMVGFDLVMALDPHWYSTLAGGYYFMTGLYRAVACWILYAVNDSEVEPDMLHNLGNLLLAFCMFSTYFLYANLLPIWYENLPEEARFVAPRIFGNDQGTIGLILLPWIYLGPIALLLWKNGKRKRGYIGFVAIWVLAGTWVERWWLVAPTLDPQAVPTVADAAAAVAVIGMFGVVMHYGMPRRAGEGEA